MPKIYRQRAASPQGKTKFCARSRKNPQGALPEKLKAPAVAAQRPKMLPRALTAA
jgi:hypothetical protein